MPHINIDRDRCKGCELCVHMCPKKCIDRGERINGGGYYPAIFARPEECTGCAICGETCPDTAIAVWR